MNLFKRFLAWFNPPKAYPQNYRFIPVEKAPRIPIPVRKRVNQKGDAYYYDFMYKGITYSATFPTHNQALRFGIQKKMHLIRLNGNEEEIEKFTDKIVEYLKSKNLMQLSLDDAPRHVE